MYIASVDVVNPFDQGVAPAEYKHYEVGDKVEAIDFRTFDIVPATVVSVASGPMIVSAAELWVEHRMTIQFADGTYQVTNAGDLSLA